MNSNEQLFLETVSDLRNHISIGKAYNLKRASGLLRQLLVDQITLLSQANRIHKLQLKFPVETLDPFDVQSNAVVLRGFGSAETAKSQVNLNQFLACHCLGVQGRGFSVKNIIQVNANVRGGIHARDKLTVEEQTLMSVMENNITCGFTTINPVDPVDPVLYLIVEITNATLFALQPLVIAIQTSD
jgi:hypothetical protein